MISFTMPVTTKCTFNINNNNNFCIIGIFTFQTHIFELFPKLFAIMLVFFYLVFHVIRFCPFDRSLYLFLHLQYPLYNSTLPLHLRDLYNKQSLVSIPSTISAMIWGSVLVFIFISSSGAHSSITLTKSSQSQASFTPEQFITHDQSISDNL